MKRKLFNGKVVEELKDPVDLTIHTKCPEKWLLIDLETRQQYTGRIFPGQYGKWDRLDNLFEG